MITTLKSTEDDSVNFIISSPDGGYLETRYVRRKKDYFIVYLSSQTGCDRGCKFCWLTTTKQTMFKQVTDIEYLHQASLVINHYKTQEEAKTIHYNWMARGEPLCNPTIIENSLSLLSNLSIMSKQHKLVPKFNVSTIMPKTLKKPLEEVFIGITPTIYYSLYSMNPKFRDKWLPGAMDPNKALDMLAAYQGSSKKIIKLHWAFIEGENDSLDDIKGIIEAIQERGLIVDFNCVRYNPMSEVEGKESPIHRYLTKYIGDELDCHSKVVARIGKDIHASCGTFYSGEE